MLSITISADLVGSDENRHLNKDETGWDLQVCNALYQRKAAAGRTSDWTQQDAQIITCRAAQKPVNTANVSVGHSRPESRNLAQLYGRRPADVNWMKYMLFWQQQEWLVHTSEGLREKWNNYWAPSNWLIYVLMWKVWFGLMWQTTLILPVKRRCHW